MHEVSGTCLSVLVWLTLISCTPFPPLQLPPSHTCCTPLSGCMPPPNSLGSAFPALFHPFQVTTQSLYLQCTCRTNLDAAQLPPVTHNSAAGLQCHSLPTPCASQVGHRTSPQLLCNWPTCHISSGPQRPASLPRLPPAAQRLQCPPSPVPQECEPLGRV